jgi:hypothetical protein
MELLEGDVEPSAALVPSGCLLSNQTRVEDVHGDDIWFIQSRAKAAGVDDDVSVVKPAPESSYVPSLRPLFPRTDTLLSGSA